MQLRSRPGPLGDEDAVGWWYTSSSMVPDGPRWNADVVATSRGMAKCARLTAHGELEMSRFFREYEHMNQPKKRDFDLIVYGATGYTGRLIAEYLATSC